MLSGLISSALGLQLKALEPESGANGVCHSTGLELQIITVKPRGSTQLLSYHYLMKLIDCSQKARLLQANLEHSCKRMRSSLTCLTYFDVFFAIYQMRSFPLIQSRQFDGP